MESKSPYTAMQHGQFDGPPQYDGSMPTMQQAQPPVIAVAAQPPPVLVMQPNSFMMNHLGTKPTMVTCPSCHAQQVSKINYKANTKTHLMAVILGVTICCCCIPYYVDSCKSVEHMCSNCGSYLGTYSN